MYPYLLWPQSLSGRSNICCDWRVKKKGRQPIKHTLRTREQNKSIDLEWKRQFKKKYRAWCAFFLTTAEILFLDPGLLIDDAEWRLVYQVLQQGISSYTMGKWFFFSLLWRNDSTRWVWRNFFNGQGLGYSSEVLIFTYASIYGGNTVRFRTFVYKLLQTDIYFLQDTKTAA